MMEKMKVIFEISTNKVHLKISDNFQKGRCNNINTVPRPGFNK